jgi:pyridoxal phosphate enzyme (YggS family)
VDISTRLGDIRDRIAAAARAAGRDPAGVRLVAVSKTVAVERVRAAYDAGQRDFGENRAQELVATSEGMPADCRWHMIGAVQTNKVRVLAARVALWHTVDRDPLVGELARRAPGATVLVEVNVADESQKAGCPRADVDRLVDGARAAGLAVVGLMCVPPAGADPRPHFAWLRDTASRLGLAELSMGMSGDFEAAVAEGATIVRIGTSIFGTRPGPRRP